MNYLLHMELSVEQAIECTGVSDLHMMEDIRDELIQGGSVCT
jgi:hypothetical protein